MPDGTGARRAEAADQPPPETVRRHIEIIKRGAAAISQSDLETLTSLISDDFELHPAIAGAFVGATIYRGKDGAQQYVLDIKEVFDEFEFRPLAFHVWRDYIVCPSTVTGRGRASGAEIDVIMIGVWRFREDEIVWGRTFFSLADALDAIGANEDELEPIG